MKVISFTQAGCRLNKELCRKMGTNGFATREGLGLEQTSLKVFTQTGFEASENMVFIGAVGIAVRAIAPHVKDKLKDPAVIVIDEKGQFVIPILSGHFGGGNQLAKEISGLIKACAVITTATDINGIFAVDVFAKKNKLIIVEKHMIQVVSAKLLEGECVGFFSTEKVIGVLPPNLIGGENKVGIFVSHYNKKLFGETMHLVPQNLVVGIGCKKDTKATAIELAIRKVFREENLFMEAIKGYASIDAKKEELGLLEYCKKENKDINFFSAQSLENLKGYFTPSEFVKNTVGTDNVCERSALLGVKNGEIIVRKKCVNGVTIAVAKEEGCVTFE